MASTITTARAGPEEPSPSAPAAGGSPAALPSLRGHMPALDGVRGLAILMVLVLHFLALAQPASRLERALSWIGNFGAFGVELFFVLSGFLITGILYDSRAKPGYFRNFYARRFLRIFPLYYGVLAALFFLAPLVPAFRGPDLGFLQAHQGWAWLYGVNVFIAIHGDWALRYIDHFWSLCVEEHFYFLWPLLVWLLASRPRRLLWVSLSLAVGAMAARLVGNALGLSWWTTYVFTPFRLDGLALGGFLAVLARQPDGPAIIARNVRRVAAIAAVLAAATYGWVLVTHAGAVFVYPVRVALILVLLATLLMAALLAPEGSAWSRFFRSRPMTWLGTYSYGLYVYHHFFSYYMMSHRTEYAFQAWLGGSHLAGVLVQALVGFGASAVIAYASYELYEKRFLSLKRLFEPAR